VLTIATIKDVARIAGVSTTTVSHVLNKTRFVSEALLERVNHAIAELNYQPYGLARSLRRKLSGAIGIVIPDNANPFFAEVVRGIEDKCFENGYSVFLCNFKSQGGYEGFKKLVHANVVPTAIFVCNDMMAIGALNAAHELGMNVPEQLSLVGFDDIALASLIIPKLTTIAQPTYELGEAGAKLLLKRINDKNRPESRIVLKTQLIRRDTCGPA